MLLKALEDIKLSGHKRVNEYLCFCKDKFEENVVAFLKNVINAHEQDCVESMAFFLDGKDGDSLQVLLKLAVSSKHVEAGSGMLFFILSFGGKC